MPEILQLLRTIDMFFVQLVKVSPELFKLK